MFETRKRYEDARRVMEEASDGVGALVVGQVLAVNRETGRTVAVPTEYVMGVGTGLLLAAKVMETPGCEAADVLRTAIEAYAQTQEDDDE